MGWDLLVSGVVQATPDKLRSSYSVMTYHKEGPACGKIPCDPTSSVADCEYPLDQKIAPCKAKMCRRPPFCLRGQILPGRLYFEEGSG